MDALLIRPARRDDTAAILALIRGIAAYEKLSHEVTATAELLAEALFGARPCAEVLLAEWQEKTVGFALYFQNFSTFLAKPGIYLEDLFVEPAHRGRGIGTALFRRVAAIARERDCGRMEWNVLNWNEPAITFYEAHGARPLGEWTQYRLTEDALANLC